MRASGMRFVGVDLAWGERNNTGLCALDASGAVLGSGRARSDEEIRSWIEPHLHGDGVVVGVDAPLVVNNLSGRRHCEAIVGATFQHREAGAYPTNRAQPHFVDGGRAARLAAELGLSVDPHFAPGVPVRAMLEVYPHTAIVCLFGLGRTIKYKRRSGRSVATRKAAFARLTELLESLASFDPPLRIAASPHWARLRAEIDGASTAAALSRAEDELDAYVCAYVGLYFVAHGERRCAVLGDAEEGYIVTPVDDDARSRLG